MDGLFSMKCKFSFCLPFCNFGSFFDLLVVVDDDDDDGYAQVIRS